MRAVCLRESICARETQGSSQLTRGGGGALVE